MLVDIRTTIGRRIHALRRGRNFTQQHLADLIGVNASYIGPLEKGQKTPSIAVLEKIAEALDQPIFLFFVEPQAGQEADDELKRRCTALLSAHTPDEREFLLKMLEEVSLFLRRQAADDRGSSGTGQNGVRGQRV